MLFAMRLQVECGQLRSAAAIAEKAAPYLHAKVAPRAEDGDADCEITIRGAYRTEWAMFSSWSRARSDAQMRE
jgi:hypothetical protein